MTSYRRNTKRYFIAQAQASGKSREETFEQFRSAVLSQSHPWIFSANVRGQGRVAKSISAQLVELQNEIHRVFALIEREGNPVPASTTPEPEIETPTPEPIRPVAKAKSRDDEKRYFIAEWKRIRNWISETSNRHGTSPVDSLDTMRPIQAARACIDEGISARTLLYAMTLHWSKESRESAGIETVDFHSVSADLGHDENGRKFHALADYVLKLARANIARPTDQRFGLMLIGSAGTGKSACLRQVASQIKTEAHPDGIPYGETPMTPGATRGDLLGRHTLDGFVTSKFVEIYSGGGIFNFEEIDAADEGMLIVMNNALASGYMFNSVNGEVYEMHDDFIATSTANTFGLGADAKYTGRSKLDLATIDRFRMGRVLMTLDESLAVSLMFD